MPAASTMAAAQAAFSGAWVQALAGADASTLPPARLSPAMAYDAATSTVVMFGGKDVNGIPLGDTWIWNGSAWTQASTPIAPAARTSATMAYDAANGTVVLFGGNSASSPLNDTWVWNGSSWTQQAPASAPSARGYASMAYDAQTGTIVLFGGSATSAFVGDTWTWDGSNWTQQAPVNSPSARAFASMAYFAPSASVVLFGGFDGMFEGDTWVWNGSNWIQQAPATNPPARYPSAMDYDTNNGTIEMFSGASNAGLANDTWAWNGSTWTQQNFTTAPGGRVEQGMVYDAATGNMVLFGGFALISNAYVTANDTWNLSLGSVNVGSVAVGQNATYPVYFTVSTAGTLGTPLAVTGGAQGLDFTVGAGSTCTGPVSAGQSCMVNLVFAPQYAGVRMGAVELTSSTGAVFATTLVQGTGSGAQISFSPGLMSTAAGGGSYVNSSNESSQDGGSALNAHINYPYGVAVDGAGNLYLSENGGCRVRKAAVGTGVITTAAGTGAYAYNASDDGGPATAASLASPAGLAVDGAGNLYIADFGNQRIRMVSAATGIISTVAGNGVQGYSAAQDGGPATSASLSGPTAVAVDGSGNLYISDYHNQRIRAVSLMSGIITTIAGNGIQGYAAAQDGGQATNASINGPSGIAVDSGGNLYFADSTNQRIRKVTAATGIISTIAGNGSTGYSASQDGGLAMNASLFYPLGLALDGAGNVYFNEVLSQRVRKISSATGIISTIAGTGTAGYAVGQDGASSLSASLTNPLGLAIDAAGNLYIADSQNSRIRKIQARGSIVFPTATAVGSVDGTDGTETLTMNNTGNLPLSISAITSSSPNFVLNPPSSGGCTTSIAIAPGDGCLLGAQFTPQSGAGVLVGTLNIAHNASALAPLPAPILSGSTTSGSILYYVAPANVTYNKPAKLSVILSYSGTMVPTGALSITVNGSSTGVGTLSCVLKGGHQNCTVPFTSYLADGTYTISATKAGDNNYAVSTGSGTITSGGYGLIP